MNKPSFIIATLAILLISIAGFSPARALVQVNGWSTPYQLSSTAGKASEGYLVADQYGYVHCFWTETLYVDGSTVIKYARFDGTSWTRPNDIYMAYTEIRNISPVVDQDGLLYIAWSEGLIGRTYYSYAPANGALSVQSWATPVRIQNIAARPVHLKIDSNGIFHILYVNPTEESGVYYVRSEDQGLNWSEPVWLDADIPPGRVPDSLNFELDDHDGLHAVWFYGNLDPDGHPDWVRYMHSLDGGITWAEPFLIDQHKEEIDHNLTVASPVMSVQGQTVHIIWAAGNLPYRNHRYSTDAGRTWTEATQIFGELHGQAFDGLTIDGAGRVHFFAQIRYPMGIYHAYWDQTRWSRPSLVYLIAEEGTEPDFGDRDMVHAHHTLPVVRAGNQLVLTFADGPADPNRRLFVVYRTLDDIPAVENLPTPELAATAMPAASPTSSPSTPIPSPTARLPLLEDAEQESAPGAGTAIQVALLPTLLVLVGAIIIQLLNRNKQ